MWLVRTTPDELQLVDMQLVDHHPHPWVATNIAPDLIQYTKKISSFIRPSKYLRVLQNSQSTESVEVVNGESFPRMVPLPCAGWKFEKDEIITVISFHRLQPGFTVQEPFFMHAVFYLYAIPHHFHGDPYDVLARNEGFPLEDPSDGFDV